MLSIQTKTPPAGKRRRLTGIMKPLKIASTKATSLPKRGESNCKRFAIATLKAKQTADFSHQWQSALKT